MQNRWNTLNPATPIVLSQIRFVCNDGDRAGIHVKSNVDNTYKLDGRTDESISFTDGDLVVIQNKLERPCEILLEAIKLTDGRRAIVQPSRQATIAMTDKSVSSTRAELDLVLGPGESCTIRSSCWSPQGGPGQVFPV
jgi:hypothetical protein